MSPCCVGVNGAGSFSLLTLTEDPHASTTIFIILIVHIHLYRKMPSLLSVASLLVAVAISQVGAMVKVVDAMQGERSSDWKKARTPIDRLDPLDHRMSM
jgi:hypothetical protein